MELLAYDVKGIQDFIFSVPKLKYVVGASVLIGRFDAHTIPETVKAYHGIVVFSGGGRGLLKCPSENTEELRGAIVAKARELGLDLRLSQPRNTMDLLDARQDLYCYSPPDLEGDPCSVSGLLPFETSDKKPGNHPLIERRKKASRDNSLDKRLIEELAERKDFPAALRALAASGGLAFVRNINPDKREDTDDEFTDASAGSAAMGSRNRWAIVAMDGNDMGLQFREAKARVKSGAWSLAVHEAWLERMSKSIAHCTRAAFSRALAAAIGHWYGSLLENETTPSSDSEGKVLLPFRPLILGGDDVVCIAHCAHAMDMAKDVSEYFSLESEAQATEAKKEGIDLWPGTDGKLSISAGVLYVKTSFPLHTAIHYAEKLLKSAKERGRAVAKTLPKPAPAVASVDWDQLTGGFVDTPQARRKREFFFFDEELKLTPAQMANFKNNEKGPDQKFVEVQLTGRPYTFTELQRILALAEKTENKLPGSMRARLLPALQKSLSARVAFYARIGKRYPELFKMLFESLDGKMCGGSWRQINNNTVRINELPDALLLLEEKRRISQETANHE